MKISKTSILTVIAVAEGVLIFLLVAIGHRGIRVVTKSSPPSVGPLESALEYESPDNKFEELVKKYPAWINYRMTGPDKLLKEPILVDCALLQRTNYARILIANGADVKESVDLLNKVGADDAVKLLRQIEAEVQNQNKTAN